MIASYGDLIRADGVELEIVWTGAADRHDECFSLSSPQLTRPFDPVRDVAPPHETCDGLPYRRRGISVAKATSFL